MTVANQRLDQWSESSNGSSPQVFDVNSLVIPAMPVQETQSLLVAAVSTKPFAAVSEVVGLELSWSELSAQCGAREQSGVSLWLASGSPSGQDVTVSLGNSVQSVATVVAQYTAAPNQIVQDVVTSNREGDACPAGDLSIFGDDETIRSLSP